MRALLITVGSRGDHEPFCSLARTLVEAGHSVDLFVMKDSKHLVPTFGDEQQQSSLLRVHEMDFTQMDFYAYVTNPSHGATDENPRVRFTGVVTDCIGELVLPYCKQVYEVVAGAGAADGDDRNKASGGCDVLVASSLARPLAVAIGRKRNVPVCLVHLQPLAPTDKFPHYSRTDAAVKAILALKEDGSGAVADGGGGGDAMDFEESYWELEKVQYEFLQERMVERVFKVLEMEPLEFERDWKPALMGREGVCKTIVANAFSFETVPAVHLNEKDSIYNVGPLADAYIPADFTPDEDLVNFLKRDDENKEPPLCIGYGSMPFAHTKAVLAALEQLQKRAVLVGDALKIDTAATDAGKEGTNDANDATVMAWAAKNTIHVSSAPYPWLLPQCSMMLCHGGAGVVNATLRAGIPCIISPLIGDQFAWAKLLEGLRLGVQAGGNLNSLERQDLVRAIQTAEAKCKEPAREAGARIRSRTLTGAQELVRVLEQRAGATAATN